MSDTKEYHASIYLWKHRLQFAGLVTGTGLLTFAAFRYKIARPSEYLVRTGLNIKDINVIKTGFQWPFQRMDRISMHPWNLEFRLQAMSAEKMEFILPGVFTVGPHNDNESLKRYARFLMGTSSNEREKIIMGVIEGETRALAASSELEQIFKDRAEFRDSVTSKIGKELFKFGLDIHNANIKELEDTPGSEYFQFLRQRARAGAENQAKIDVADAAFRGNTGSKAKERETRIKVAEYESEAVIKENERNVEVAESNKILSVRQAEFDRESKIARIEAEKAAEIRNSELQKTLEEVNQSQTTAALRAQMVSEAVASAEARIKEAEGHAQAIKVRAEADLYAQQQTAEGIRSVYQAQAEGVTRVMESLGGDSNAFLNYEMVHRGIFPELAKINAGAIQGLNPKITVWSTGSGSGESDYTKTIRDIAQCIPPLTSTISDQTGLQLPEWILKEAKTKNS